MDRRAFLAGLAGIAAGSGAARAQGMADSGDKELADLVGHVAGAPDPIADEQLLAFAVQDRDLRLRRLDAAREGGVKVASARLEALAAEMRKADAPLLPPREAIVVELPRLAPIPPERPRDAPLTIVIDILVETLGIGSVDKDAFAQWLSDYPDLEQALRNLAGRITTRDWNECVKLIDWILGKLVEAEVLRSLLTLLGAQLGRTMLIRFGLRLVPILGWGYLGLSFLLACKRNYQRFA